MAFVGIDFGTTHCCVSTYLDERLITITNPNGNRTTPSYVSILDSEIVVGEVAKINSCRNVLNTFFDVKRVIGKKYSEIEHGSWNFNLQNIDGTPMYVTERGVSYTAEDISTIIFTYLKKYAEEYIGTEVSRAVITVPANYNDSQRRCIRTAAELAGLDVMWIISEPTSAILAYGLSNGTSEQNTAEQKVVVFDCGGGTIDISVANILDGIIEVIATGGNPNLGGNNFDTALLDYCVDEIKNKHGIVLQGRLCEKLRKVCEQAKKELSVVPEVLISLDAVSSDLDYICRLTRSKFEYICSKLFTDAIGCMISTLELNGIDKGSITSIIMVGGSSKIPYLRRSISSYFDGMELLENIDPDEVVSHGAAIQAKMMCKPVDTDVVLIDITSNSFGIEVGGDKMSVIVPRHTPMPCTKKRMFTTYSDNQHTISISVYEGENEYVKNNRMLGSFKIQDLPRAEKGSIHIEVMFNIDGNGLLYVTAIDQHTKKMNNITIKYN